MTSTNTLQLGAWICVVVLPCLLSSACASGSPQRTPAESSRFRSQSAVHEAIQDAFERSDEQTIYSVSLRQNTPHCGAPSYEIFAYGRWTRVFLDGDRPVVSSIRDALAREDSDAALRLVTARGRIVDQRETSSGLSFPVFEVQSFDEPVLDSESPPSSRLD